jgi:hypothetical protein
VREVEPGVLYLDLARIDHDQLEQALIAHPEAAGVIFDLRGEPDFIGPQFLGHWIDEKVLSPEWEVPLRRDPTPAAWIRSEPAPDLEIKSTRWPLDPVTPRLGARLAFLADERSISRAETYLAIARFQLGAEVVGSPSAGTLGNSNRAVLPGGFRLTWTGMNVRRGSSRDGGESPRLSGSGIAPTLSAAPTTAGLRAGRDEALARAVDAVSR